MAVIRNYPRGTSTTITLVSSSADLKPFLGGPIQRISRLADKWQIDVTMRPMTTDLAAEIVTKLMKGLSETLTLPVKDGLDTSHLSDNGAVVGTHTGGTSLAYRNARGTPLLGQFISIIDSSARRYLHRVEEVDASNQTLTVFPALKTQFLDGDTIEFADPKIEGFLTDNKQAYTVGLVSNVGVTFTLLEAR